VGVRAGDAVLGGAGSAAPPLEIVTAGGDPCGTIAVAGAGGGAAGALSVEADGSLLESGVAVDAGARVATWRWWPALLR
jgi:hypothetical protein